MEAACTQPGVRQIFFVFVTSFCDGFVLSLVSIKWPGGASSAWADVLGTGLPIIYVKYYSVQNEKQKNAIKRWFVRTS